MSVDKVVGDMYGVFATLMCMLIASEIACRELRQARGQRLGALQRKFPVLGLSLLYVLAALELFAFPLLGAGTAGTTR